MSLPPFNDRAPVFIVSGLVSRPDLNGCVAVALGEGATPPASADRVAVIVYGTGATEQLALKPASLLPIPYALDESKMDWTICVAAAGQRRRAQNVNLASLISDDRIGSLDLCHEFVAALLNAVRPVSRPPLRLFSREAVRAIVRTPSHDVYWFKLDAISHYFVLEVMQGRGRLFQSSVLAHRTWKPALRAAHARWGGGRILSPTDLCAFLGALTDLQAASERVTADLMTQLDGDLVRGDAEWAAQVAKLRAVSMRRRGAVNVPVRSPLHEWTGEFIRHPGAVSFGPGPYGSLTLFSNDAYAGKRPFVFNVPERLLRPFSSLFTALTGQEPVGSTYITLLHYAHWREQRAPFESPDIPMQSEAAGWGFFETIHWRAGGGRG